MGSKRVGVFLEPMVSGLARPLLPSRFRSACQHSLTCKLRAGFFLLRFSIKLRLSASNTGSCLHDASTKRTDTNTLPRRGRL